MTDPDFVISGTILQMVVCIQMKIANFYMKMLLTANLVIGVVVSLSLKDVNTFMTRWIFYS